MKKIAPKAARMMDSASTPVAKSRCAKPMDERKTVDAWDKIHGKQIPPKVIELCAQINVNPNEVPVSQVFRSLLNDQFMLKFSNGKTYTFETAWLDGLIDEATRENEHSKAEPNPYAEMGIDQVANQLRLRKQAIDDAVKSHLDRVIVIRLEREIGLLEQRLLNA